MNSPPAAEPFVLVERTCRQLMRYPDDATVRGAAATIMADLEPAIDAGAGGPAQRLTRAIEGQCTALLLQLRAARGEPALVQELALRVLTCLEERRRASG